MGGQTPHIVIGSRTLCNVLVIQFKILLIIPMILTFGSEVYCNFWGGGLVSLIK